MLQLSKTANCSGSTLTNFHMNTIIFLINMCKNLAQQILEPEVLILTKNVACDFFSIKVHKKITIRTFL